MSTENKLTPGLPQGFEDRWNKGGVPFIAAFEDLNFDRKANETAAKFVRDKIKSLVKDSHVAKLLTPDYPIGCKRLAVDSNYYEVYNKSNITLVDLKTNPLEEFYTKGIKLNNNNDEVVGMIAVNDMDANILVVSENGYGKRSNLEDYRVTNRGGKGVKTISITDKTGELVTIKNVNDQDDLMIINKSGIAIRMEISGLRVMGRATQGVKLINLKGEDTIAAVAKVMKDEEEIEDINDLEVNDDTIIR